MGKCKYTVKKTVLKWLDTILGCHRSPQCSTRTCWHISAHHTHGHWYSKYAILLVKSPKFCISHDDVIKWKHFLRYWPFVRGIHRSPVNSLAKGQWRGALMFSLICVWINDWVNNREDGDLRRYRAHCDVTVMSLMGLCPSPYLVGLLTSGFKTCGNIACGLWWRY